MRQITWQQWMAGASVGLLSLVSGAAQANIIYTQNTDFGVAAFGGGTATGQIELVNDDVDATDDACEPLVGFTPGRIALIRRGVCTFVTKVKIAQDAGAIGALVFNNTGGGVVNMASDGSANAALITIPSLFLTQVLGNELVQELASFPSEPIVFTMSLDARTGAVLERVVPEPATLALLGLGLAGLALSRRKRS